MTFPQTCGRCQTRVTSTIRVEDAWICPECYREYAYESGSAHSDFGDRDGPSDDSATYPEEPAFAGEDAPYGW